MQNCSSSQLLFEQAETWIPGGVNSPVRAFKQVGGTPRFFKEGKGAYITDVDNNQYVDYVGSFGPAILGHAHPHVVAAAQKACQHGFSFGAPTEAEVQLAEFLCTHLPGLDQVRLVNSGTEATMSAIRLARGYTKRQKIIKFIGCYHGHVDALLVQAGSGGLTFGYPNSLGVSENMVSDTLLAHFNDADQVRAYFEKYPEEIAAVIVEPVAGNMNLILPTDTFLPTLRSLCSDFGALLIFDEVMTGFRIHPKGAAGLFGITPDIITLAKIIGGGMPIGAFGGRQDIMQMLSPLGGVYQAGTMSGNPIVVATGLATLQTLYEDETAHQRMHAHGVRLNDMIGFYAKKNNISLYTAALGGMFGFAFTARKQIVNMKDLEDMDVDFFKRFFHVLLEEGVYLPPSAYETCFLSTAHDEHSFEKTERAVKKAFG